MPVGSRPVELAVDLDGISGVWYGEKFRLLAIDAELITEKRVASLCIHSHV